MSGSVVFKAIMIPRNDREFVQQAAKRFADVLTVDDLCSHTKLLERDHQGIAEMCRNALVPVLVRKTNRDYAYSMLFAAALTTGAAVALTFLKSGSYKTVLIGAVLGLIVGGVKVYFDKEVDLKETDIKITAGAEKIWMRSKQPGIEAKLKEAEEKIATFTTLAHYDNEDNKDVVRTRDQLFRLKSYFDSAIGAYRPTREG